MEDNEIPVVGQRNAEVGKEIANFLSCPECGSDNTEMAVDERLGSDGDEIVGMKARCHGCNYETDWYGLCESPWRYYD